MSINLFIFLTQMCALQQNGHDWKSECAPTLVCNYILYAVLNCFLDPSALTVHDKAGGGVDSA
jgi:hypothetical protein